MQRSELESKLETLREKNRILSTDVVRNEKKLRTFQLSIRSSVENVEREEELIMHGLLRHIENVTREKELLVQHLKDEEIRKTTREKKLTKLKADSAALQKVLKDEEDTLRNKLQAQVDTLQAHRMKLEEKVSAEAATLQELTNAVRGIEQNDSMLLVDVKVLNDRAMLGYLTNEIGVVQQLQEEAKEKIALYTAKRVDLEKKIADAAATRQAQKDSVGLLRTELARAHEQNANSEVLAEWATDREFFCNVRRRRTSSVGSSVSTRTIDTSEIESTPRVLHGGLPSQR